jgi:hypothetical protein
MAPAELPLTETITPPQSKGYQGRNMTLPASWWTSSSLFQLERRAIFAKVPPPNQTNPDMALRNPLLPFRKSRIIPYLEYRGVSIPLNQGKRRPNPSFS